MDHVGDRRRRVECLTDVEIANEIHEVYSQRDDHALERGVASRLRTITHHCVGISRTTHRKGGREMRERVTVSFVAIGGVLVDAAPRLVTERPEVIDDLLAVLKHFGRLRWLAAGGG